MEGAGAGRAVGHGGSKFSRVGAMLRQAAAKYEDLIVRDPDFTSKLESWLKATAYILPGAHQLGSIAGWL